jgi:hypothetical protein
MKAAGATEANYADVDSSQGFWQIQSTSATINGQTVERTGNTSIMDTGTTLCLVDDKLVEAVYKAIPGSKYDDNNQGYVFPANTSIDQLPDVTLAIGDAQVSFQKEDLGFADAGNGMVFGSIQSRGTMDMDIYGDAVLKAMYAVSSATTVSGLQLHMLMQADLRHEQWLTTLRMGPAKGDEPKHVCAAKLQLDAHLITKNT